MIGAGTGTKEQLVCLWETIFDLPTNGRLVKLAIKKQAIFSPFVKFEKQMGGKTMATTFLEPADNKKHQLACMEIRPGQWHNRPRQRVLEIVNFITTLYTASFSKNIILTN